MFHPLNWKVNSQSSLLLASRSLAPVWRCSCVLDAGGRFCWERGILCWRCGSVHSDMWGGVGGGGPARFSQSVTVVPRHFLPVTPLTCDWISQTAFQFWTQTFLPSVPSACIHKGHTFWAYFVPQEQALAAQSLFIHIPWPLLRSFQDSDRGYT